MGGTTSKTTLDIVNDVAVSATQRTIQNCTTTATQSQLIQLDRVDGNLLLDGTTMKQGVSIKMDCVFEAKKQSEIQTEIANEITQKLLAESQGMLQSFGGTDTEATATVRNMLNVSVTQEDIQNSITMTSQSQGIKVGYVGGDAIVRNTTMEQTSEIIARSMMSTAAYSAALSSIASKMDQAATSKGVGLDGVIKDLVVGTVDSVGNMLEGPVAAFALIAIVALIVGAVILIKVGPGNIMKMFTGDFSGVSGDKKEDEESDDEEDDDAPPQPKDKSKKKDKEAEAKKDEDEESEDKSDNKSGGVMESPPAKECRACDCIVDSTTGACRPGCTCPCHSKTGGGCGCNHAVVGGCCGL